MIFPEARGATMMGNMTKLNMSRKMTRLSMTRKRRKEKYDRIPVPNIPVGFKADMIGTHSERGIAGLAPRHIHHLSPSIRWMSPLHSFMELSHSRPSSLSLLRYLRAFRLSWLQLLSSRASAKRRVLKGQTQCLLGITSYFSNSAAILPV